MMVVVVAVVIRVPFIVRALPASEAEPPSPASECHLI